MSGKYSWKLIVTTIVVFWAVVNLTPFRSTEFETYVRQEAKPPPDLQAQWQALLEKADARENDKTSFFLALRQVAEEEQIDLSKFFPQIDLEKSLGNIRKRNSILLGELLRNSRGELQPGLDLAGGVSIVMELDVKAAEAASPDFQREQELSKAIEILRERIDGLGVAEPVIRPIGDNRIEVQMPGVTTRDNPDILTTIQKPARLDFRLVHPTMHPSMNAGNPPPAGYELMTEDVESGNEIFQREYYVKRRPEMSGEGNIADSFVQRDDFGNPRIIIRFTGPGGDRFAEITGAMEEQNIRERRQEGNYLQLAIVLDGKLYSAPHVKARIAGGSAEITGRFTETEAFDLANVLKNPLDTPLRIASLSEVGPTLAEDSVASGRKAFIIGTSLTAIFIAIVYTTAGLLAVLAMALNVIMILGVLASDMVGATLTMPGIAGIVLTLGMSVDSNILIFERIREELATGKSLRAAIEAGHERAFSAIFDANVTTLITAAIMMWLGTGPVKGFGVTLTIGIFTTMFAALVITRGLLELVVLTGLIKRIRMVNLVPQTNIDFMKYARPAFLTSWTIVVIGLVVLIAKGGSIYGTDFTGGDEVTVRATPQLSVAEVTTAAVQAGVREATPIPQTLLGTDDQVMKVITPFGDGEKVAAKLSELYPDRNITIVGETRIGPAVSSEIKWNALMAIGLSLVGILIYVAFRFEFGYGVGAVLATIHDVLMTIGIFVLFDRQFNSVMVGAVLLIVGYSINDTIVVFDRIREELTLNPSMRLRDVINLSLNRTLARTIITGGTTFFTAITLFVVAGGAVNDLALTLIIGIITGTFSSVFIASPIFYWWHKGDRKHVEASHDIAPKYEWSGSSRAAE